MKNKMPQLFEVNLDHPDEIKSKQFISKLQQKGFFGKNKVYINNYIDSDVGIVYGHIKNNYKKYVIEGSWSEEKFEDIIDIIAKDRKMLIPNVFLRYGIMYDDGKLTHKIAQERRKYEVPEKLPDEQELLDYINKHGGRWVNESK